MISANNISLTRNKRQLLNGVNLEVKPGSFTAMAGPNGAGKSSFLKVIAKEISADSGEVLINGIQLPTYSPVSLSKVRAVLPQNSHLQFPFSVRQVIELGQMNQRRSHRHNKKVLEEVVELTAIEDLLNRNFLTLSGGEQQRVQLTRVIVQVWEEYDYPRYILLDEPTSNLDMARQQLIFGIVKQACKRNIGVLAVVHDLNHVAQFADHLYLLKEGLIVAKGTPKQVFTKAIIEDTFCCRVNVYHDPCTDCPYIIPEKNHSHINSTLTVNQ